MLDLVKRLDDAAIHESLGNEQEKAALLREAAAEIRRLQAAIQAPKDMSQGSYDIVELIEFCGIDNVGLQYLNQAVCGAKVYRPKGTPKGTVDQTAVSFVTQEVTVGQAMGLSRSPKSGVVLWLPQDKLDELKALRA